MSEPLTEEQGDRIIDLLESVLSELQQIAKDANSIEFEVKFELSRIRESITHLKD